VPKTLSKVKEFDAPRPSDYADSVPDRHCILFSSLSIFIHSSPSLVFSFSLRGRTLITTFTFEDDIGNSENYMPAFDIVV
jgi:hypothetical protein